MQILYDSQSDILYILLLPYHSESFEIFVEKLWFFQGRGIEPYSGRETETYCWDTPGIDILKMSTLNRFRKYVFVLSLSTNGFAFVTCVYLEIDNYMKIS